MKKQNSKPANVIKLRKVELKPKNVVGYAKLKEVIDKKK